MPSSSVSVNAKDGAGDSLVSSASKIDSGKSHKEAERRRRQRINSHLSTLRSLLPNTTKTDKASLLAEVVQHVRELRRKAADWDESNTLQVYPGDTDEARLSECGSRLVNGAVCCEDRPGLNKEVDRAVRSVRGRLVSAEMATVGGRTRIAVVVELGGGEECFRAFKQALKAVVENRFGSDSDVSNKRARVCECKSDGEDGRLL